MKKLIIYAFVALLTLTAVAQEGWNWPEDPELKSMAVEKQAYYKLLLAQSKHGEALHALNWLYENNGNLNQSIYIEGVDILKELMKDADGDRQGQLKDSILWMFDKRIEHFDNDAATLDRKAYQAFQLYYKQPSKFGMLIDVYEKAYEANGPEISTFNLNSYMFLAKLSYQHKPDLMPAEKVLDIHTQISDIIDIKKKNGGNKTKLDKEQAKTDGWLDSIGEEILTCQFIEENLVPKFREDPSNIPNAKKIFKYSLDAKCTDQPYWLEASETVFGIQPSYNLAKTIGNKYIANGELNKGLSYHSEAIKLASNNEERFDAFMGQAIANSKLGNKTRARALAYEALSAKPGSPEAYNLIGNLYFTSFDDCQGGKSKVLDRGVFLAAYKMYERAGNKVQMNASKEQFPSNEEIFSENYKVGESITVGCWINETVELKRRD